MGMVVASLVSTQFILHGNKERACYLAAFSSTALCRAIGRLWSDSTRATGVRQISVDRSHLFHLDSRGVTQPRTTTGVTQPRTTTTAVDGEYLRIRTAVHCVGE